MPMGYLSQDRVIGGTVTTRKEPALDLDTFHAELDARPWLRGRLHLAAAVAAIIGLVVLVANAHGTGASVGAWIYGLASVALYAVSGCYHVFARSPRLRRIMRKADHTMIYVLIAGTFTPVAIVMLDGVERVVALSVMWVGTVVGMVVKILWIDRFRKLGASLYIVLGWAGLMAFPALLARPRILVLIAAGGILYTVGAVLFALHRPRLDNDWFGFHEVWHTFGISAGVLLFIANLNLVSTG